MVLHKDTDASQAVCGPDVVEAAYSRADTSARARRQSTVRPRNHVVTGGEQIGGDQRVLSEDSHRVSMKPGGSGALTLPVRADSGVWGEKPGRAVGADDEKVRRSGSVSRRGSVKPGGSGALTLPVGADSGVWDEKPGRAVGADDEKVRRSGSVSRRGSVKPGGSGALTLPVGVDSGVWDEKPGRAVGADDEKVRRSGSVSRRGSVKPGGKAAAMVSAKPRAGSYVSTASSKPQAVVSTGSRSSVVVNKSLVARLDTPLERWASENSI